MMNVEQLRAVANEKAAEAQRLLDGDQPPDMEKVTSLIQESEGYLKRADLMADAQTLIAKANPKITEPEQKSGIVVTADEEDKKKAVKTWTFGEFAAAVALNPDSVRAYRSKLEPDHYDVTEAVGQKAIGSLTQARINHRKAITGLSETVPADGGFLVQTDWGGALMDRVYADGELLRLVVTTPISGNSNGIVFYALNESSRADGSRWGGVRGYWVAEGGEKTISHQTYRRIELALNKVVARVPATDELLQDTTALESEIQRIAPAELRFLVEQAIVAGTGAGQPLGILTSPALITQAAEAGQAAATIVSQNIINMWSRRWVGYRDYVWLIDQSCEPQLMQMNLGVGTAGGLTYMPPGGLSVAPYATLMGRPVIPTEHNSVLGTVGDIILWSPSSYRMIEKGGVQSASSIHVRWVYDETEFRFVFRCDGQPEAALPLTPHSGGPTQGPMVVLATRS